MPISELVIDELDGEFTVDEGSAEQAADEVPDLAAELLASVRRMTAPAGSFGRSTAARTAGRGGATRRVVRRSDPIFSGPRADARDPAPVGAVCADSLAAMGWSAPIARARVLGQWAEVVGADIALHCQPVSLLDSVLKVAAESTSWATQLRLLAPQILARLNAEVPVGTVTRIVFSGPAGHSWVRGPLSIYGGRGVRDTYG